MSYSVSLSRSAVKFLKKQDRPVAEKLMKAIEEIGTLDDPRSRGKALTGSWGGFWRYRVGSYRIICEIKDNELQIIAVKIGSRDSVY